jgi:hypothetical protein
MDRMEPFGGVASFLIADLLDQPDDKYLSCRIAIGGSDARHL